MIMKQIFFFFALFCMLLTASCKRSSTIQDLPFAQDSVGNQVLVITHSDSSFAQADFYIHTPDGWQLDRSADAFVGKMGVGKMREGDARTPLGYLGILSAFGIEPNPGTQIPYWDEVKRMCLDAMHVVPQVRFVAWDVAITPDGPVFIEGNSFPSHAIPQFAAHFPDGIGILPRFEEFIDL